MKIFAWIFGGLAAAAIGWMVLTSANVVALDFRAFYCAGHALRVGQDPYRTASLQTCERSTGASYRARLPNATLPAPQPPFDIAIFAIFAALPFAMAKGVWGALIGMALFGSAVAFAKVTTLRPPIVIAVLGTSLFAFGLSLGQILPFFMCGLCVCALALKESRLSLAGFAAAMTLVEPHMGAPVCAALFLWQRETRPALLLSAAALAIAGVFAAGIPASLEYVTTILPLHALSEIDSDGQLSLSTALHALSVPVPAALVLGTLSYAVIGAIGVWAGRASADHLQGREYLAAVPAASAVLGGTFVHPTDIVAALPAAALFLRDSRRPALIATILVVLTVTWTAQSRQLGEMVVWFAFSGIAAGYIMYRCGRVHGAVALSVGAIVLVALFELNSAYGRAQQAYFAMPPRAAEVVDEKFPQAGWSRVIASSLATDSVPAWLMRAPTWIALIALLTFSASLARRPHAGINAPVFVRSPVLRA